jgi:hypothetical protein
MKITEVITESRQQLNEQLWRFTQMIEYAVSRGGVGIEQALLWIAKKVAGKPGAAKELAEAWMVTAEKAGISSSEAIAQGSAAARSSGLSAEIIAEAEREAAILARARANSVWGKIKTGAEAGEFYWGATLNTINTGLKWWGILEPIYECVTGILKVYRMHDEGHPELQDKAKMQWAVQWYIDNCVQRVTALLAGRMLIRGVLGKDGIQRVPLLNFSAFNKIYDLASPAAQAAFQAWMITNDGQQALAKWLVGEALVPGTDWKVPGGALFRGMITDPISGLVKSGYDAFLRAIKSEKAQQLPEPKDPNTPVEKPKPGSLGDLAGRKFELGRGRATTDPSY